MRDKNIDILIVDDWEIAGLVDLYREGNWWNEDWDPEEIRPLIKGSFLFAVACNNEGKAIGMGRVISDGCSDGYVQDLVVHRDYRGKGIGRDLLCRLVSESRERGLSWIGLIAEPGTSEFYTKEGFSIMTDHIPLVIRFIND